MPVHATLSDDKAEVTIEVSGRFDFSTYQEFSKAFKAHPKGEKRYVVDLSDTDFIGSSAMGMLLELRDYGNKSVAVRLVNVNDGIREALRIAQFDKLFAVG